MSSWFLYIVECEDGSLYTGIAVDPQARFAAHLAGKGARYTRSHRPRSLLLTLAFPDRSSALKAEYHVKQMPAQEKRRLATAGVWGGEDLPRDALRPGDPVDGVAHVGVLPVDES
jgi:putative endonuclease